MAQELFVSGGRLAAFAPTAPSIDLITASVGLVAAWTAFA